VIIYKLLRKVSAVFSGVHFVLLFLSKAFRIRDIAERSLKARFQLKADARSAAWAPNGTDIAVGLTNGTIQVLRYVRGNLEEKKSISKKDKRVQCLSYSLCGKFLAAGTADNVVLLFDAGAEYRFLKEFTGNSSVINHVDFSSDSKFLQTCSQSYELLFYDTITGSQFTKSRELKDQTWATFTSILGWDVQGIWPAESDGSDINCVAKSGNSKYLASAEDSGLVKVFNYPCVGGGLNKQGKLVRRPESQNNTGHSSHVTSVAWTQQDQFVVSTGGNDLCVFQWKVVNA